MNLNRDAGQTLAPRSSFFALLLLLTVTPNTYSQIIAALGKNVVGLEMRIPATEQVGTDVVQIVYRREDGGLLQKFQVAKGTGFFVSHGARSYIVTAKHVVGGRQDTDGEVILVGKQGARIPLPLGYIRHGIPGAKWFIHPTADAAIHPYMCPRELGVINVGFPDSGLRTNELELLSPVCTVGFPFGWGLGPKISPIATECKLASWAAPVPTQGSNLEFILLDKALAQGYSGAPIYTLQNPFQNGNINLVAGFKTEIIGLLSSQEIDSGGGKVSLIVPALYLVELFRSEEFQRYERRLDGH